MVKKIIFCDDAANKLVTIICFNKQIIDDHYWFIFEHYCSNKKYEKLKSLIYRFFAIYFLSDVTET